MRIVMVLALVVTIGLTACSTAEPSSSSSSTPTETRAYPSPTPTSQVTEVDPSTMATKFPGVDGVDFTSVDGNLMCGIFLGFSPLRNLPEGSNAYGGCAPLYYDYPFEQPDPSSQVECSGASLTDARGPEVICTSGASFMGVSGGYDFFGNPSGPLATLPGGSRISVHGITCDGIDDATIRCSADATGEGFEMSRSAYTTF